VYSVVSNGILLDSKIAAKLLKCQPFAVHVSLDSLKPVVYKRMRGSTDWIVSEKTSSGLSKKNKRRRLIHILD